MLDRPQFDIVALKTSEKTDYELAGKAFPDNQPDDEKHFFIGRSKHTFDYINNPIYSGRILNPEARGEKWSFAKNAAFMLGAIETSKTFLILTAISDIGLRAQRGVERGEEGLCKQKNMLEFTLGYTTAEILWLQDNGYTFKRMVGDPSKTLATAPATPNNPVVLKRYGHVSDSNARQQVDRLLNLASALGFTLPKPMPNRNSRNLQTSWLQQEPQTQVGNTDETAILAEMRAAKRSAAAPIAASSPSPSPSPRQRSDRYFFSSSFGSTADADTDWNRTKKQRSTSTTPTSSPRPSPRSSDGTTPTRSSYSPWK